MYLSYVGIRVTNLERSLRFYTELFNLEVVSKGDNGPRGGGQYVLLRDVKSGQKLELNCYPDTSPYAVPYVPGEGLDHVSFRVRNVEETLRLLAKSEVKQVDLPDSLADLGEGVRVAYVKDPDGNWIELYQNPRPIEEAPKGY